MAYQSGGFLEKQKRKRAILRASDLASTAHRLSIEELREARRDLAQAASVIVAADHAVEMALADRQAALPISGPEQCDWRFRPKFLTHPVTPHGQVAFASPARLAGGVTLFHDCSAPELGYRQIATPEDGAPPYALMLDVYRFSGSFISLVQDLPDGAVQGLALSHFFEVRLDLALEHELELYARLNLQHGPNTEQLVREMPVQNGQAMAQFDLAYSQVNEKRMEKIWLDLILEAPRMTKLTLNDFVVTRAPRADV